MKTCSKCKLTKETSCFAKHKLRKDGLHNECKQCVAGRDKIRRTVLEKELKEKSKNYYVENKESILLKAKEYRENNADKISEYQKEYATSNRQKLKKYLSIYIKKHRETNRDLYAAKDAKRRAAKLQALPPWLTPEQLEQIKELYTIAQMFKLYTGEEYHVDHIVPLQGENVCGLHVPWNLQVIPAKENLSKSNKLQEDIL
jgi:hypothetical protein